MGLNFRHSLMDAGETIFFQQALELVIAKAYDIKYPLIKFMDLFPINTQGGPGVQTMTYRQYDMVGMAKIIANYADDLPRVDVMGKEFTAKVKSVGDSFGYSLNDMRAARQAGEPLEQRKANAAKEAMMRKLNQIAFTGEASYGIPGILTNPNVSVATITGGWASATADQILADLNLLANTPVVVSNGVEAPDTMIMTIQAYNIIKNKRLSTTADGTSETVLGYFLKNNGFIKQVEWVNELKGAGSGNTDVVVAYRRDPDAIEFRMPQAFEQLPPQERNLETIVNCHSRTAGMFIYYPLSVVKAQGT